MSIQLAFHQLADTEEHVHFCACSPDGKHLACALASGTVCVLSTAAFVPLARGAPGKDFAGAPATCVRWAPLGSTNEWQLVSTSSAGGVLLWAFDSAESTLRRCCTASESGNEVLTVDVSPSGKKILTAGSDRVVRLYDSGLHLTHRLVDGVNPDGSPRPTHINRIFSVRFLAETLAASAGWESSIQLWDLRSHCSNRQVLGLQGNADCLDPVTGTHVVLAASPKTPETLQLFDSVTGRLLEENSRTACAELEATERVMVCRYWAATGHVWCLTVAPPSLIVLALATGKVEARVALAHSPLSMMQSANGVVVGCKNGVLIEASLVM